MTQQTLFLYEDLNNHSWFTDALTALNLSESSGWPDNFGELLIKWNQTTRKNPIRVLSLFSGAGGLDIGFHDAGFQIVECIEIEKFFAATLYENSKPGKRLHGSNIVCTDIKDFDPSIENIDFIIGGPPCQTFSAASARAAGVNGIDDDRGNLFKQYVRILKKLKPRGFLFENVYRIVGAQGGEPWKQIQDAFREAGYKLHWRIMDTADFGVPQFRERLIIVGLKEGKFQFPYPTHGPDSMDNRPYYTAASAIDNVVSKTVGSTIGGRHGYLLNEIPPGLNYSFYTEKMGHPTPHFGWRSKFSDYLYKADPKTPVRTIKAQGGQYTGPFHWESRVFTIEELKRLQTFPDNYEIIGNRQKVIHQLGNSVPPQFARILALSILQQVFDVPLPFKIQLLPDYFELGFRARKSQLTEIYAKKAAEAISKITINYEPLSKISEKGKSYGILTTDLVLLQSKRNEPWDYYFEHDISDGQVHLRVWDKLKKYELEYEYSVHPKVNYNNSGIDVVIMQSFSEDRRSITAVWKYLERLLKKCLHKDDLVQLFGYYQYTQNYTIDIDYKNSAIAKEAFWQVLSRITRGELVRKLIKTSELSYEYGIEEATLFSILKELKLLGFEIRSHNTNKQIKDGYLLVPYSFPSLNERSLQRLTEL